MRDILKELVKIISYQENLNREGFILKENRFDELSRGNVGQRSGRDGSGGKGEAGSAGQGQPAGKGSGGGGSDRQDTEVKKRRGRLPRKTKRTGGGEKSAGEAGDVETPYGEADPCRVSTSLDRNRGIIEQIYGLPVNKDVVLRDFTMGTDPPVRAFIVYIDGLADRKTLNPLLQDLMIFATTFNPGTGIAASSIMKRLLPGSQVNILDSFEKIADAVNYGDTAFFFEGSPSALVVETKGWEHRSVDRPETEQTITGPQEGFTENLRANTALVRRIIRSEKLYTEFLKVGVRMKSDVALMYIKDLASPDLVAEVKRRVSSINTDYVNDTGILEQYIEDSPYNINSQAISTERPDRVASYLAEGKVALILSGSPYALVVPATMFAQLHTAEETYLRWQYGTFIRYVRTISFYLALLLPGIYVAIVLYHQEMIPTELLLAIAGSREKVPFPTVVELLLLEFSFELVREAGVRIPGIIGSTIGIVGALILGQAAVQANIVSPLLVILVAATGLGSFAIPNFSLAFSVRIYRFFYILMGAMLGIYGITIGLFIQILITANLKSFGVPYLSPAGPRTYSGPDVVMRAPIFTHRRRPDYLNPQDDLRMPQEPRKWVKERGDGGEGAG